MLGLFHVRDLVQSREFEADLTDYSKKRKKKDRKRKQHIIHCFFQKWVRFYGGNNFCFPSDLLPSLCLKSQGFVVCFFVAILLPIFS